MSKRSLLINMIATMIAGHSERNREKFALTSALKSVDPVHAQHTLSCLLKESIERFCSSLITVICMLSWENPSYK
jgi:hypothetical protein